MKTFLASLFPAVFLAAFAAAQSNSSAYGKNSSPMTIASGCPWLTTGSAARALGGEVTATIAATDFTEGSCRFLRQDEPTHSLEIVVGKSVAAQCPTTGTKLVGIGNEAVRCRISLAHSESADVISGRVRELRFSLVLRGQGRGAKPADVQDDTLEQLAEQVAGNLF